MMGVHGNPLLTFNHKAEEELVSSPFLDKDHPAPVCLNNFCQKLHHRADKGPSGLEEGWFNSQGACLGNKRPEFSSLLYPRLPL